MPRHEIQYQSKASVMNKTTFSMVFQDILKYYLQLIMSKPQIKKKNLTDIS